MTCEVILSFSSSPRFSEITNRYISFQNTGITPQSMMLRAGCEMGLRVCLKGLLQLNRGVLVFPGRQSPDPFKGEVRRFFFIGSKFLLAPN